MIAVLLLSVIPVELVPTAEVDQVWYNHVYDAYNGDLMFDQIAYWRWYGEGHRSDGFHVRPKSLFQFCHRTRKWVRYYIDTEGTVAKIITPSYREGPVIGDPEVQDRELLEPEFRVGRIYLPPLGGRLYVPRHP